jgi:hypothetical protein
MYSVVTLVAGQTAGNNTYYTEGGVWSFRSISTVTPTECTLLMPDGDKCSYKPLTTPLPHKKCTFPNALSPGCTFGLDILSRSLSGLYTINSTITNGVFAEVNFLFFLLIGKTSHFVYSFLIFSL